MADTTNLTIQQAFSTPFITKVISLIPTPDDAMQRFYGLGIGGSNTTFTPTRAFGWDQFNKTRTVGTIRAPMTDAGTIKRQKIGQVFGHLLRSSEKLAIYDEEIAYLRPPGAPIGTLDQRGEQWVIRQVDFQTRRNRNLREFLTSRMLLGGFGIAQSGDNWYVTELNAATATINVDMQIPASHLSQCAVRPDGSSVFNVSLDDPTADVVEMFFALYQAATRESGWEPKHVWCDGTLAALLMNNASLQSIAGSANRVWNTMTKVSANVEPGDRDLGGMSIRFNAIPFITFHVNNAIVNVGSASNPQGEDSFAAGDATQIVPANKFIITPDAGDWCTMFEGQEPVRETWTSQETFVRGFHSWTRPFLSPPGRECYNIDNFLPGIVVPRATYAPTVVY